MSADVVQRFFEAWNRHAIADMLACFGEDAVYDPAGQPRLIGREAVEGAFIAAARDGWSEIGDLVVLTEPGGLHAAAEYTLRGRAPDGTTGSQPAGSFFEVEDGRIARLTSYAR